MGGRGGTVFMSTNSASKTMGTTTVARARGFCFRRSAVQTMIQQMQSNNKNGMAAQMPTVSLLGDSEVFVAFMIHDLNETHLISCMFLKYSQITFDVVLNNPMLLACVNRNLLFDIDSKTGRGFHLQRLAIRFGTKSSSALANKLHLRVPHLLIVRIPKGFFPGVSPNMSYRHCRF
jgi:hypothetical protein